MWESEVRKAIALPNWVGRCLTGVDFLSLAVTSRLGAHLENRTERMCAIISNRVVSGGGAPHHRTCAPENSRHGRCDAQNAPAWSHLSSRDEVEPRHGTRGTEAVAQRSA